MPLFSTLDLVALGWFISPWLLMATSVAVAAVLWRRQSRRIRPAR